MVDVKEKSRAVGDISEHIPEELVHFDCVETPRDWKEERNRNNTSNVERNLDQKVYDKEKDLDKDKNMNKQKYNDRNKDTEKDRGAYKCRDKDKNRERDEQKSPHKKPLLDERRSPGNISRSGQARTDKDRGSRREIPKEREERDYESSRETLRGRERSRDRERRRSGEREKVDINLRRHDWDFDRSRSSPSSFGGRGSYRRDLDAHRKEYDSQRKEHDSHRMEHDSRKREHDSNRREHDSHRMEHDSRRREHDLNRIEHDLNRREQDSNRREQDSNRREHDRREHDRRERSKTPSNSYSRRFPPRERRYSSRTEEEYRKDLSPHGRPRSPHFRSKPLENHSPRPVSPQRRGRAYREMPQRSPIYVRDTSPPRKRTPVRDVHSRMQPDRHRSPEIISGREPYSREPEAREDGQYESKKRYSPVVTEYAKMDNVYDRQDANVTPGRKSVFDRISSSNREVTISNKYLSSPNIASENRKKGGGSNRTTRMNQNYLDNTVSTLRDLSDRPLKRDREEPPPPSTEPPSSWVEEKRARLRSRIESEDILDMELIILSGKQREYSEKVEQRIRHMGVTTNLITLPPSMGVAEALDSAVRRNLLYAIIILPQHEQHNSITLTILHGRNPQEHKNMPLEDSLCLINLDHQKYEEAIKDGFIQARGVEADEKNTSPDSTPDKPKLDLDQLSEIIRKFPQAKEPSSELNRNSQDLQAKILGLLGSSAIIPSKSDTPVSPDQSTPSLPILPEQTLPMSGFQSPMSAFSPIPGCPPHRLFHPNFIHGFPHPAFNFPPGSIPFPPGNLYLSNPGNIPNLLGHHPPFPTGFPPRS